MAKHVYYTFTHNGKTYKVAASKLRASERIALSRWPDLDKEYITHVAAHQKLMKTAVQAGYKAKKTFRK